jgi:ribonucleotide reductase alpha subunit
VETYANKPVNWGYTDAAGNSLGEITFLRTYSRIKPDGSKECWYEVCRRVIEWMYAEQKNHCKTNRLPWNDHKAQRSAQDAYDRMFNFKWTPPGRGLWIAGTPMVAEQRNSAALNNCSFISTADMTKVDPAGPFKFMMEALMLGVGVGFDDKGADKEFAIYQPGNKREFVIPDTREGWVDSVGALLESYLMPDKPTVEFDYSLIRPAGEPIKTFGGTAAGPGPLRELHQMIRAKFTDRAGSYLSRVDVADIGNQIGVCVVSGNVRRSALLIMGRSDDKDFINLKNPSVFPERTPWMWMSNNSVEAAVGDSYNHLIDGIALNGEPGIIWMDVTRQYGRLVDPPNNKDRRAAGFNPCLAGDTIIETVDGPRRLQDITEPTVVYSKGADGKLTTAKASAAFKTRENAPTLRINLQNGDALVCTPDHRIMLRDGSWIQAQNLQPNDSLEVLCRTRSGWRYAGVRLTSQPKCEQVMEHRLIWEGVYGPVPAGFDVDHVNRQHQDNRVDNLRILSHSEHSRLSRSQVPNNHQVHGPNPRCSNGHGFVRSGLHGVKPNTGAIGPIRPTGWKNQHTVVSITKGPSIDVYDLTVDETHNFVANNVVVHNCAEQSLESQELCTLVECYLNRHDSLEDFQKTLKFAYLYAKTVTLLPTHWERTNAIMQRNRRIGCGVSGMANFADNRGLPVLRTWLNKGYETVQRYDRVYSEWLCVRESIKTTTVKPSGSVSILSGESPGVHWAPGGAYFNRAIRLAKDDPMVPLLRDAGYTVEDDVRDDYTVVAYFPIHTDAKRAEGDVTIFEKANLAAVAQRYWSDNSVSVTLSFDAEKEAQHVGTVIHMHEGQLKTVSFLPMGNTVYPQQPYTQITEQQWEAAAKGLSKVDLGPIYRGEQAREAVGERFCTTDTCELKAEQ